MKNNILSPVDAVWLAIETPDTPMHLGVMAIFQQPRSGEDGYIQQMVGAFRGHKVSSAPWNCRLRSWGGADILPALTSVKSVDLDYHFRHLALPEPGGERELGTVVSRLHSLALDRNRPLWEFYIIEGLANQRFAVYLKVHHVLVADINALPLMFAQFADSARKRNTSPFWARSAKDNGLHDQGLIGDAKSALEAAFSREHAASVLRAGSGILRSMLSPKKASGFLLPSVAPRSTLNRQINGQRRFATAQLDIGRIEAVAKASQSTRNEILTYLCSSSLRRFFKEYNVLPDESLVGLIPVSLQDSSQHSSGRAIAGIRVKLATEYGDSLRRLEKVKKSIQAVREDRAALPEEAVGSYALLRAAPLYASQAPFIGRFVPPAFNLQISNSLGSNKPLYFNGARLEAIYPMAQLQQHSALSIDCVNYAGALNVGFTGARDTLPHLQRLAVYVERALDELEQLLADAEGAA